MTRHTGRCLCGHYRFTAEGTPIWVATCHCESCRRATGAPLVPYVGYPDERVRFAPAEPPFFTSSPGVARGYCEQCATPLYYRADGYPGETHLFRSNFEQPTAFTPTRHTFYDGREADMEVYDDLPRYGGEPYGLLGWGPRPAFRVLFLCTGNSARSILAEAVLNLKNAEQDGRRVRGHSAGSNPTGQVNPGAVALLQPHAWRLDRPRSKSWDEFTTPGSPPLEWVITLCDNAAGETCPVFHGAPRRLHWGLPDPASGAVTFEATWQALEERIDAFLQELGAT